MIVSYDEWLNEGFENPSPMTNFPGFVNALEKEVEEIGLGDEEYNIENIKKTVLRNLDAAPEDVILAVTDSSMTWTDNNKPSEFKILFGHDMDSLDLKTAEFPEFPVGACTSVHIKNFNDLIVVIVDTGSIAYCLCVAKDFYKYITSSGRIDNKIIHEMKALNILPEEDKNLSIEQIKHKYRSQITSKKLNL